MPGSRRRFIVPALALSLLINLSIIVIATVLAGHKERRDDITAPVGVDLVDLQAPEPSSEAPVREAAPPAPQEKLDVTPDLFQPELSEGFGAFDPGVAIDIGKLAETSIGEKLVFESYELDQAPTPLVRVPPLYPYAAREKSIEGLVQVRMLINPDGSVGQIQILDARPPGIFEDAVKRTLPQWRFNAGKIDGRPVTAWVVTTVRFNLD
jgi:protein TonB